MGAPSLAAIASIPERSELLLVVLESLRSQVDKICVYLNGYQSVPVWLPSLADEWVLDAVNQGAERKFHWADRHEGLYFTCDDDILYPSDYVKTLAAALDEHGPRCIVSAHGRTYVGQPMTVHEIAPSSLGLFTVRVDARPINHGGTGVMAWDARTVKVPPHWVLQNIADMQVAVWAQTQRIPMWLVAHQANWLRALAPHDPAGIFAVSQRERHRRRNELLRAHGMRQPWTLHAEEPPQDVSARSSAAALECGS